MGIFLMCSYFEIFLKRLMNMIIIIFVIIFNKLLKIIGEISLFVLLSKFVINLVLFCWVWCKRGILCINMLLLIKNIVIVFVKVKKCISLGVVVIKNLFISFLNLLLFCCVFCSKYKLVLLSLIMFVINLYMLMVIIIVIILSIKVWFISVVLVIVFNVIMIIFVERIKLVWIVFLIFCFLYFCKFCCLISCLFLWLLWLNSFLIIFLVFLKYKNSLLIINKGVIS